MTAVIRAITAQAAFKRYTLTNIVRTAQDSYYVCGMSADRVYLFARNGSSLYQSSDDGATWTLIHAFPTTILGMQETKNGECLVSLNNQTLYRSSGWSTGHAGATWTLVLTTPGEVKQPNWNLKSENFGTNGVIVFNEYGAQTSAGTESGDAAKARRVWYSADDGLTWKVIFDISTSGNVQYGTGLHMHSCCYHETDDRIYITWGDGTGAGGNVSGSTYLQMGWSDDRGATWQYMPIPSDYTAGMQFVNVLANDSNIILQPDGVPYGLVIIPRTGYRALGQMRSVNLWPGSAPPTNLIGQNLFKARSGNDRPIIATMAWFGSIQAIKNRIMMSADDGTTWAEAYRNTDAYQAGGGMSLFGPTVNGKVVGQENSSDGGSATNLLKFSATLTTISG